MLRKHISYANVIASVALFIALGGSAVAAATLTRDSVGAPQIRKDAVRSPEIREETIKLGDIGDGARDALLGDVEVREENDGVFLRRCDGTDVTACPNLLAIRLNTHEDESTARGRQGSGGPAEPAEGRNWLVQAKMTIHSRQSSAVDDDNLCGLVLDSSSGQDALLDEGNHTLEQDEEPADSETIVLTTVLDDDRLENPRIALRCTAQGLEQMTAEDQKITALEVGKVIGP